MLKTVNVSAAELAEWAEGNGVDLRVPGNKLAVVNERRAALDLPPFKVVVPKVEQVIAAHQLPPIARTEAELLDLVRTFDGTRIGTLTPECAGWLLRLNTGNRPLNRQAVARFVAIIERGDWKNTSEAIIVSRQGQLNDGQHRLHAVVQVKKAVEVDVRFGVEREAFAATNTGARRTAGQTLHILGEKNTSAMAGIARLLLLYDRGQLGMTAGRVVETGDVLKVVEATPAIAVVARFLNQSEFTPTKGSAFGFVIAAAARVSSTERAMLFATAARSGREPDGDATRDLHTRLLALGLRKQKANPLEISVLTARAWNTWVKNKRAPAKREKLDLAAPFPRILGAEVDGD